MFPEKKMSFRKVSKLQVFSLTDKIFVSVFLFNPTYPSFKKIVDDS